MFETIQLAPPDAILGLTEAYRQDDSAHKMNLAVGVYKDDSGGTPVLECVKLAEQRLVEEQTSKSYLAIDGDPVFDRHVSRLLFGDQTPDGRTATVQTPGGTGALRVAADFLHRVVQTSKIWVSDPTWANHPSVFEAAGMQVAKYPYFDPATNGLDFQAMMAGLEQVQAGEIVLLHGCCHNPTGVDMSPDQWQAVGEKLAERGALPLIDFAYQGFADGLESDAAGLRQLAKSHQEMIVCSSFSKNFGLYCERVGALVVVSQQPDASAAVLSQLKRLVRTNYSNPPAHGAKVVATVLEDQQLTKLWHEELATMRDRINGMRRLFVKQIALAGVDRDYSFIEQQRGMFSFLGLTPEQVRRLRDEFSIYIVGSGRMNVAGITDDNVSRLCESIAAVL